MTRRRALRRVKASIGVRAAFIFALLTAAALAAGCTTGSGPSDTGPTAGQTTASAPAGPEDSVIPNLAESGTHDSDGVDSGSDPVTVAVSAPPITDIGAHLPLNWNSTIITEPGWTSLPLQRSGLLLGFSAPTVKRPKLRYLAVSSAGTILWRADRPATCSGFALSQTEAGPIAVLTDLNIDGGTMSTTASGYDLATGAKRWGPVAVPGSLQGPGLVFASPAPASAMGAAGPRMALDPASGRVVADETAASGLRVIGEYDGTVVTGDADLLYGINADSGETRWRAANPDALHASAAVRTAQTAAAHGALLVNSGPGTVTRLIDAASGAILANSADDAGFDTLSSTWVVLGNGELSGFGPTGEAWARDVASDSSLIAVGSGLAYTVSDGVGKVFNTATGADARAYDPGITDRFAVPQLISLDGGAVFRINGRIILATTTEL